MPNYSNFSYILFGLEDLLNELIRKEFQDQGHSLTQSFENSLTAKISANQYVNTLSGYGNDYGQIVDQGIPAEKITWAMLPGLIRYFTLLGLDGQDAKQAAFLTIQRWMSEGMPTKESYRFSKTGERTKFIETALNKTEVDDYMFSSLDLAFEEASNNVKSEII